ncbi:MAG: monovalent cation/H+ antiporter subunit A [Phenylobacterium sp.]|jgi:multicomponent K+:H+ antiporter subunit A|uniref:monovalent cation/H+ antiporter subunit A n=1 Tax=Phenylobacterium sp. TaxID=1871053 RepID=UPI002A2BE48B|nr:monovalent cation/H+ antiporter subunit A [Phenylobacterium sp.]MDD3836727.1 monovalent cation/H+ antiporter subunit A [Phenylobacterium sp.]MDX9998749.1 monovalent cation/H+ antiporter subunit A [Phenylobacterium sp.]
MTSAGALLILLLATPFVASFAAAFLPPRGRNVAALLAISAMLLALVITLALSPEITSVAPARFAVSWAPSLGLEFTLRADGFVWIFLMLICGVGLLVSIYARYYMSPEDPVPRFFSLLLAFAGSMIGLVLSGNVVQLVVFWEMTSLLSFLLIGYWHHGAAAREGARTALIVTSAGGLCLLAGLLLLARIVGSYDLDIILRSGAFVRASPLYGPTLALILLGAFTKSAQFPFHFWLPQAMAAPTPVSAYLHSATMVKAGVFLLVTLWPVLSGTEAWYWTVSAAGLTTLAVGAFLAIFQNDLKGVLAYSTISHLGLITFLLGLNSPLACVAAIFHIVNHAIFKASLFMAAGAVDHEAGTRDMRRLGGLIRFMPVTTVLATVAAAAMAGVPLLNGFLSKEMFFEETLAARGQGVLDLVPTLIAVAASGFAVIYSLRFIGGVFFGQAPDTMPKRPHEPPVWMVAPIGLLALLCLVVGTLPAKTIGPYLARAAGAVLGPQTPSFKLAVWHGLTPALAMSSLALVVGVAAYILFRRRLLELRAAPLGKLNGRVIFEQLLGLVADRAPSWVERRFPGDRLQPQLLFVLLAALAAATVALSGSAISLHPSALSTIDPAFAALWAIGGACAIGAAMAAKFHRLAALILLGGAGLVSCVSFVWLSAPDLATTQLLVEVVTTILILLGLRWLPARVPFKEQRDLPTRLRRARDAVVAVVAGAGMSLLAYGVMMHPVNDSISQFFLSRAYAEGGGRNVVNVILVDFRGFDTFGEITVLGIVALSVFALLRRFRPAEESLGPTPQKLGRDIDQDPTGDAARGSGVMGYLRVPGLIIQMMAPIILLFAVHLFLRGHDLPGGGFSAGLTASVALILLYMARGVRWVEARIIVLPVRWIAVGLLVALATGAGSFVFGYPFLTSYFTYLDFGPLGRTPLATALLFDLGVFILVVGATTLILIAIAHQSLRTPRRAKAPAAGEPAGTEGT